MTAPEIDWDAAVRRAREILDNPSDYGHIGAAIELARQVIRSAPKPTLRQRILDLPVGTVFEAKDDDGERRRYVIIETNAVRDIDTGRNLALMRADHDGLFSAWSDKATLTIIYTPEVQQ